MSNFTGVDGTTIVERDIVTAAVLKLKLEMDFDRIAIKVGCLLRHCYEYGLFCQKKLYKFMYFVVIVANYPGQMNTDKM